MKSVKTTEIEGDVSIGRNITNGGNTTTRGNSVIERNLTVKGWLNATNIRGTCKGLFATEKRLNECFPLPQNGWWAFVSDTLPAPIYRADGGSWTATGQTGGEAIADIDKITQFESDLEELKTLVIGGKIDSTSIGFTSTATGVNMNYTILNDDGTTTNKAISIPVATSTLAGVMTSTDKANLDRLITDVSNLQQSLTSISNTASLTAQSLTNHINEFTVLSEEVTSMQSSLTSLDKKASDTETELSDHITEYNSLKDTVADIEETANNTKNLGETTNTIANYAINGARFKNIVESAVIMSAMATASEDENNYVVYISNQKLFAFKTANVYYNDWQGADKFMNTSRTEILKDKVYLYGSSLWAWDESIEDLSEFAQIGDVRGKANGIAPLDESALIPEEYLPDSIDDVVMVKYWSGTQTVVNKEGLYWYNPTDMTLKVSKANESDYVWGNVELSTDKIYINLDGKKIPYIWDGTEMVAIAAEDAPASIFNVTNSIPISGYYVLCDLENTSVSAVHAAWNAEKAVSGLIISFEIGAGIWKTYQFIGKTVTDSNWFDAEKWKDFGSLAAGSETYLIIDSLIGKPDVGEYYTLETAVQSLLKYQSDSGVTYAKKGLIISYATAENVMETKQFQGEVTDIGEVGLWKDFGGGSKVETAEEPEANGIDALSTGGAYKHLPANLKVDTEDEGVIKIEMINANNETIGDQISFPVGTGSGESSGTIVNLAFKESPMYANANSSVILQAAIRSVTMSGQIEALNIIESVQLLDRDTIQVLETYRLNKASSADLTSFDFSFDLSSYFTKAGQRRFSLVATDDSGHTGTRNINVTAVDLTISSVQTLNYTSSTVLQSGGTTKTIPMYKFANNASDKGILCKTEIYLGGEWKVLGTATINDTYSHSISVNPNNCVGEVLSHGAYPLRIHGEDVASGVVGNYLHTAVMVVDSNSTDPIVVTRWYSETVTAEKKLYEKLSIDFAAYSPAIAKVTAVINENGVAVSSVDAYRQQTYSYTKKISGVATDGTVIIEVNVLCGTVTSQTADFVVKGSLLDIEEVTSQLQFSLDFSGRNNSESDHSIKDNGVTLSVTGANWRTNGFVKDSFGTSSYGTENDAGYMTLRIAEDVTGELDYKPFDDASIEQNGMAIQFAIQKRNIAEDTARLISCISGGFGFFVDGKNVVFTTDGCATVAHTITAALQNDTQTNVAIVIEPSSIAPYSGIGVAKMYFDGEEIGACYYDRGTLSKHSTPVTFNGTHGDLYLYHLKAWKTYYGFEQSFHNYLLKMQDSDAMITEYEYNNVMASQTAENNTKNRPQANSLYNLGIPYFVLCKNANTADNEAKDNYPNYLEGLDGDKKTTRVLDVYAYFPDRPWQDFKAIAAVVCNQGTTSSKRPIKNIKMKLKAAAITLLHTTEDFTDATELDKFNECLANAAKHKVQVTDNSLPTNIITVKVDYSESGGANNGASTQLYNELQRALGANYMTPAQNAYTGKYTLNTSIDSIPCAFFRTDQYSSDATSPSYGYFHAKGNWNEDKGDAAVFGFEKVSGYNDKCLNYGNFIELVASKNQELNTFKDSLDTSGWKPGEVYVLSEFCGSKHIVMRNDGSGTLTEVEAVAEPTEIAMTSSDFKTAFNISDYDADSVYHTTDGKYLQYKGGSWINTTGTMTYNTNAKSWSVTGDVVNPVENYEMLKYDYLDWFQGVNTVDDMLAPDTDGKPIWLQYFESRYPDDDDLNDLYESGKKVPYQLYRLLKFCQDCNHHLTSSDGDITIGGETVTGTAENRLKKWKRELHTVANVHSMICYHVFTDYIAAVDQRSKNMMVGFYLDTDGVMRMYLNHLYDGDTILGSDNDCGLTVDAEINPNDDAAGVYQGHDSVLFMQLANSDTIWLNDDGSTTTTVAAIADEMRTITLKDGLKPFSYDGLVKYWITDRLNKYPKVVSSFDGERKYIEYSKNTANYFYALHGLSIQRLKGFIKTRFLYRDGFYQTGDMFSSLMSMRCTGTNITIKIKAAKDGYFGVGVDRANVATDSCYLKAGEEYTLQTGMSNSGSGTALYIFGADKLAELDISNATPSPYSWDISELTLLQKLKIGGESYAVTNNNEGYLAALDLGNMPFLEELDVRNTKVTSVNATYCPRLATILAGGSQLQSCTIAETCPISTLQLPSTMTNASLINLPKLTYPGGLTFDTLKNVNRIYLSNCPNIDTQQFMMDCLNANAPIKYIRVEDLNVTSSVSILELLKSDGAIGLDESGTAIDESNQCSGLTGRWIIKELISDEDLATYKKYFPELTIYNSQYSLVGYDDTVDDTANYTNYENSTGYKYGNTFKESGHFTKIKELAHIYQSNYDSMNKIMKCTRVSDDDYTKLYDGTGFDNTDTSGIGFDIMKLIPHYWYKGVNDYKNQLKYFIASSSSSEPISTASKITRKKLSEILVKTLSALLTESMTVGEEYTSDLISSNSNMNVYELNVTGMKQVRWTGVNNTSICAVFLDADNKIISTFSMAVGNAFFDFVLGDYVFTSVPSGAKRFLFTSPTGYDDLEAIAVDSSDIEAIEPDWVEHSPELVGVYGFSVDALMRARSISGVKTQCGINSVTNPDWTYDDNGKLTNVSVPTSTMNYSYMDYINICKMRGDGFQAIDYETSKNIANLYMATQGNRDEQSIVGYGVGSGYTTGAFDSIGNTNSVITGSNNGNVILGLQNFVACNGEWMDNVAINISSWANWIKNKRLSQSEYPIDAKWHIYDPIKKTERIVQGLNVSEYCIGRVKNGRYADVIASRVTSDNSKWNKNYGDGQYYTHDRGRVVCRSNYYASANGGLVYASASNVSSSASTLYASRLAFRGEIEFV